MTDPRVQPSIAIVDYGLGNLFSVKQACDSAGMHASITSTAADLVKADAVILPGVGAFGNAMSALRRLDLVAPLLDIANAGRPLVGICLGMQLLMTESTEFGNHRGLGLINGTVARFPTTDPVGQPVKVPQVGWNRVHVAATPPDSATVLVKEWQGTLLTDTRDGEYMYFVHSYYVVPEDPSVVLSHTSYGGLVFSSTLRRGNLFACQYHPERSGRQGLRLYNHLSSFIAAATCPREN